MQGYRHHSLYVSPPGFLSPPLIWLSSSRKSQPATKTLNCVASKRFQMKPKQIHLTALWLLPFHCPVSVLLPSSSGPNPYHRSGEDQKAKLTSRWASTLFQMARLGFETVRVSMCTREMLRENLLM